jgi:hypothetical protein
MSTYHFDDQATFRSVVRVLYADFAPGNGRVSISEIIDACFEYR